MKKTISDTYKVYLHTVPKEISGYDHDKYYVGITNTPVRLRWGNGSGYRDQFFGRAIRKYGWENIKHEIILGGMNSEEAVMMEQYLIASLHSNELEYGYNRTAGGKDTSICCKPVAQYDLDGNFIRLYEGRQVAADANGWDCITMSSEISHGYMWRDVPKGELPPKRIEPYIAPQLRRLEQYTLQGEYIKTYSCFSEAQKDFPNLTFRYDHKSYGYQWKYEDEDFVIRDVSKDKRKVNRVYLYNIDGTYHGSYKTKRDAWKETKTPFSPIPNWMFSNIYNNLYKGYRWTRAKYDNLPPLIDVQHCTDPVVMLDKDKNVLAIFPSLQTAYLYLGKDNGRNISRSAMHNKDLIASDIKLARAYGFVWIKVIDLIPYSNLVNLKEHKETFDIYNQIVTDLKNNPRRGGFS